jgi:hypothetical protein
MILRTFFFSGDVFLASLAGCTVVVPVPVPWLPEFKDLERCVTKAERETPSAWDARVKVLVLGL